MIFLFDLNFDFLLILIVPCRTRGISNGFWCEGKCEGRKFALTLALTTETPINRAFQTNCEGVRAKKEKKFFLEVDELTSQQPQAFTLANPFKIPMHR